MATIQISDIQLFNVLKSKPGDQEMPNIATRDFVEAKISDAKFQIILWAFVFWVTQLGAIFAFLKFLK